MNQTTLHLSVCRFLRRSFLACALIAGVGAACAQGPGIELMAYFYPQQPGASWLYQGKDWDGKEANTRVSVADTNWSMELYTGRNPVQTYHRNVLRLRYETGHYNGGSFTDDSLYDEWFEHFSQSAPYTTYGNDDGSEQSHMDGGLVFPEIVNTGSSYAPTADAYVNGRFQATVTDTMQVLDTLPVTVPAGTFPDCVHLRFRISVGALLIQSWDEWWARGVGIVKMQGVSGDGKGRLRELVSSVNPVISPALKSLPSAAQSYPIAVTTAGAWTASESADWVSLDTEGGTGNGTVTVNLTENTTGVARQARVTIAGASHWISQAAAGPQPDIAVQQPKGTPLASGGTKAFGTVALKKKVTATFVVANTGAADLTGTTVTISGPNITEFKVTANLAAPIKPGKSKTFKVQFAPASGGAKSAQLRITSNDPDESPYLINLTGSGPVVPSTVAAKPTDEKSSTIPSTELTADAATLTNSCPAVSPPPPVDLAATCWSLPACSRLDVAGLGTEDGQGRLCLTFGNDGTLCLADDSGLAVAGTWTCDAAGNLTASLFPQSLEDCLRVALGDDNRLAVTVTTADLDLQLAPSATGPVMTATLCVSAQVTCRPPGSSCMPVRRQLNYTVTAVGTRN